MQSVVHKVKKSEKNNGFQCVVLSLTAPITENYLPDENFRRTFTEDKIPEQISLISRILKFSEKHLLKWASLILRKIWKSQRWHIARFFAASARAKSRTSGASGASWLFWRWSDFCSGNWWCSFGIFGQFERSRIRLCIVTLFVCDASDLITNTSSNGYCCCEALSIQSKSVGAY